MKKEENKMAAVAKILLYTVVAITVLFKGVDLHASVFIYRQLRTVAYQGPGTKID